MLAHTHVKELFSTQYHTFCYAESKIWVITFGMDITVVIGCYQHLVLEIGVPFLMLKVLYLAYGVDISSFILSRGKLFLLGN